MGANNRCFETINNFETFNALPGIEKASFEGDLWFFSYLIIYLKYAGQIVLPHKFKASDIIFPCGPQDARPGDSLGN